MCELQTEISPPAEVTNPGGRRHLRLNRLDKGTSAILSGRMQLCGVG
jgi:hypothetical protein